MTRLIRRVRREVEGLVRESLIITLYPSGVLGIRAKRTRREYTIPLITVYRLAIDAERAARTAARRTKRGAIR